MKRLVKWRQLGKDRMNNKTLIFAILALFLGGASSLAQYSDSGAGLQRLVDDTAVMNNAMQHLSDRLMTEDELDAIRRLGAASDWGDSSDYQPVNYGVEEFRDNDPTSLVRAASHGILNVVQNLINNGADVNWMDENKWSPLMAASTRGYVEVVDYLLDKGADVNAKDQTEWTPLMLAAKDGYLPVVKSLLDKGADVNAKNVTGKTAINYAAKNGFNNVVELLKIHGAME